jgi:hypothetical protein
MRWLRLATRTVAFWVVMLSAVSVMIGSATHVAAGKPDWVLIVLAIVICPVLPVLWVTSRIHTDLEPSLTLATTFLLLSIVWAFLCGIFTAWLHENNRKP